MFGLHCILPKDIIACVISFHAPPVVAHISLRFLHLLCLCDLGRCFERDKTLALLIALVSLSSPSEGAGLDVHEKTNFNWIGFKIPLKSLRINRYEKC